jgi:MFS family permease
MRELARIRDFRLLFAGLLATMVGDLLLTLMLAVWVQKLTGSDGAAGITFGCGVIAYAVSPLIAWPVDRFRRRPLVITANVCTAAILIPLLTVHHAGRIWVIYAVAVAYGVTSVIAAAASQGLIGLIVPAASMPDAYGALQTARQSSRVFVPVLGVVIYTRVGPTVVVVMTIVSLLASTVAIAAIRAPETRPEPAGRRWMAEMTAGARQLASDRVLSRITVGNSSAMLAAGAFAVLGFAVVTEGLGKPASFLSVLISVQAGTAIVGAMLSARIVKRLGEVAATSIAFALAGVGIFLTVFPSLSAVVAAYALAGFAVPLGGVSAYNALQHRTPARLFARTMVAFASAVGLPQAIAIPAAAVLLATVGFRTLVLICFAIAMLASAYVWRGRALTQRSREATPTARPLVQAPCPDQGQPAPLAPRRQSRRLDTGGVIVGSGAVLVDVGDIRRFESTLCECSLLEEHGFTDLKIPAKHHDPLVMFNVYRRLAARCDYPLLEERTGALIRVPLRAPPVEEVKVGIATLESLGLRERGLGFGSCPSCGRARADVYTLAEQVAAALRTDSRCHRRPVEAANWSQR